MMNNLPPLKPLRAFEAAARHQSFTRAASELCLTQAAISRQIRTLESHFGVPLFLRQNRTVRLTAEGQRLYRAVSMGLAHIASASSEILLAPPPGKLTVGMRLAFASLFMPSRIGGFKELYPDIDLHILATERNPLVGSGGVDIAISLGCEPQPGQHADLLFSEEIFPVCSPYYLARRPRIRNPEDLLHETLLHLHDLNWQGLPWRPIDWPELFRAFDVAVRPGSDGLTFNNYHMMIQTAVGGNGIAMGWLHLVKDLLDSGHLVRPVAATYRIDRRHYLVTDSHLRNSPAVTAFCDWLIEETACFRLPPEPHLRTVLE